MKKLTLLIFTAIILTLNAKVVFSQEQESEDINIIVPVNSFEVFWPMVAGKTKDDGIIYSIKRAKESFREALIFGAEPKASYKVFLGTKRILEAEKLLNESKNELAISSLDEAESNLSQAQSLLEKTKKDNPSITLDPQAYSRTQNIGNLADWLSTKYDGEVNLKLTKISEVAKKLL